MKKILIFVSFCVFGLTPVLRAQFTNPDTVKSWAGSAIQFNANITNTSSSVLTIKWQVVASDFPSDWINGLNLCDNASCRSNGPPTFALWNGFSGGVNTTDTFSTICPFDMPNTFSTNSVGTHFITINLKDAASSFNKNTTFIISHPATGVTTVTRGDNDVILYPNPAVNDLNVVFNETAGIRTISIYDIIGKAVNSYKVAGNSAHLSVDNLPSGVYFIRLLNGQGSIVATRKFNKQ